MCDGVYAYKKVLAYFARKLKASSTNWLISIISPKPWLANFLYRITIPATSTPLSLKFFFKYLRNNLKFQALTLAISKTVSDFRAVAENFLGMFLC
jgi:hypothetical protein